MATDPSTKASARFAGWIADQLTTMAEVRLTDLTARAMDEWGDDFALWQEMLPRLVYEEVQRQVARQRQAADRRARAAARATATASEAVQHLVHHQERVAAFMDRFYEHVGNRHIRLGDMTRDDLLEAAAERTIRGRSELARAEVFRRLADPMRPGETVRQAWSPDTLVDLWSTITAKEALPS